MASRLMYTQVGIDQIGLELEQPFQLLPMNSLAAALTRMLLLVAQQKSDEPLKINEQIWNFEDTFAVSSAQRPKFREWLELGLDDFDKRDENVMDWNEVPALKSAFLDLLLDDFLLLDLNKPPLPGGSKRNTYFEIELAALRGVPHETCGGRTPNDDVIDTTLTLFINGPKRDEPRRSDGIDEPAVLASDVFPYLQAPLFNKPIVPPIPRLR